MLILSILAFTAFYFTPSWLSSKLGAFSILLPIFKMVFGSSGLLLIISVAAISLIFGGWLIFLTGCHKNKKRGLIIFLILNFIAFII